MKTRTVLLWAIALFAIDQTIKIVINQCFIDLRFDIIPPLFYFKPKFNIHYSWVNDLFKLGWGFWTHIVIYCFVIILIVFLYDLFKTISDNAKIISIAFSFIFAAALCASIDTICWGGSLDYIYLKPLFIFDLKDLYSKIWMILLLLYVHKNRKYLATIKTKDMKYHFKNLFTSIKNIKNA